jgi:hypothetical protein
VGKLQEKNGGFFFASLKRGVGSISQRCGSASKCHGSPGSPTLKISKGSRNRAKIVSDSKDSNSLKERFV